MILFKSENFYISKYSVYMQRNLQGERVVPKEGYIFDYATGKPVDIRKPEETVRQEYEKILNDDYDYDPGQLDIEVFIQRGSKTTPKNEKDRADIVIYKSTDLTKRDQNQDILGIVETKRPQKKEGIRQLQSYMSASSALWGVWTNGKDKSYLYKNPESGEIKPDFVFQIPAKNETWENIGRIKKDTLIPASNLKPIFKIILSTLYANTNISRREKLGNEMIKLIFCKIWDERYYQDKPPKFKIGFTEDQGEVAKNIKELFEDVKRDLSEDGVFDKTEEIKLEDRSIAIVVGELERYSLHKTDKDVVGDAFEVFAESKFVGEKGEFFTPREVVKTAIKIVNPKPNQKILDPACGSGGFLIYALENVWNQMDNEKKFKGSPNLPKLKQEIAEKNFFGIDKEPDLVKISKAYMAIVGDGRGGIVTQNTLHRPEEYEPKSKELFVQGDNTFKKFDIIITNPPFGSKIKVLEEESKYFDLGHIWKFDSQKGWSKTSKVRPKGTEPQVLFVERCLQMLTDGGTLAIVLPETYFHAPEARYVLNYIKSRGNIKTVVDLPHNTFRPHNNAKTILLVMEKGIAQQPKITLAVAEQIGHNHRGEDMFRYDNLTAKFTDEKWDDTIKIREELDHPDNPLNKYVFTLKVEDIKNDIYVPRYYWNKKIEEIKAEAEKGDYRLIQMKRLMDEGIIKAYNGHGSPDAKFKGLGEIPYVRVADISNWMVYKNPTSLVPREVYARIKGKRGITLKERDILYVRRGSYRIGSVAFVTDSDREVLLTREITVFRVINKENEYGIDPNYLLFLLSHEITQKQLNNKIFIDTTLPNIADRWKEVYLPIFRDNAKTEAVKRDVEAIYSKINSIKSSVNLLGAYGHITT